MLALSCAALALTRAPLAMHSSRAVLTRASKLHMSTYATFKTTKGDFKAELYMDKMPITCSNFADLSKTGFYDGLSFHRVINGFMCQFGCPNSKDPKCPSRGRAARPPQHLHHAGWRGNHAIGGKIPDELICEISNEPGTLSMANTGQPNTGGSQIFINTVHNDFLDYFNLSTPSSTRCGRGGHGYRHGHREVADGPGDRYRPDHRQHDRDHGGLSSRRCWRHFDRLGVQSAVAAPHIHIYPSLPTRLRGSGRS